MLSSLLAVLGVFGPLALPPAARYEAFMTEGRFLSVDLSVTMTGVPAAARATFRREGTDRQSFRVRWGPQDFEFRQSPSGILVVLNEARQYGEYPVLPTLVPPPREVSDLADMTFPEFLLTPKMDLMFEGLTWTEAGQGKVGDVEVDLLTAEKQLEVKSTYEAAIDRRGRLMRIRVSDVSETTTVTREWTMSGYASTALAPEAFAVDLPWGYVPYAPPDLAQPVYVGAAAPFQPVRDVGSGQEVDLKAEHRGKWVAVLFTAPDCLVSRREEHAWLALREALASKECDLIEVSLGPDSPPTAGRDPRRRLFQDVDGRNEGAFGVPGTPYVFVVRPDGRIGRAWWGLTEGSREQMVRTLLEPFRQNAD